ncbi:MAG TPA: DUF2905 domain-containing protein [Caulobacteraceae bacterium]|jgi:hypothetical protein|nr:DUF2905 domain-containing protein [Caulobacteraceae bacterium]
MSVQRLLLVLGAVLVLLGLVWPWLGRLGIGRLPGDLVIRRGGFVFYAPIVTCLIVSAVSSLVLWLMRR